MSTFETLADEHAGTFVTDLHSGQPCLRRLTLIVVAGPDAGLRRELKLGTQLVGSHKDADLRLQDPQVSRRHLEVALVDDGVRVVDLGSKNGVYCGKTRISQAVLPPGERLTVGGSVILLEAAYEPMELGDGPEQLGGLLAKSPAMRQVFALLARAARSSATVLLEGETGVGKDVLARALHAESARAARPLLVFDCAAVSKDLLASELFGHKKGAFTGANEDRAGVFEAARGGTVFLDEVGELPLDLQPSLLRVLEGREVRRVGENTARPVDVRVVAATNRALADEVEAGRFRQDLYYRLAIIRVAVPPLRERREDIDLLVDLFLAEHGLPPEALPPRERARLREGAWPGNVRELRNVIEQSAALSDDGAFELYGLEGGAARPPPRATTTPSAADEHLDLPYKDARAAALAHFERLYLERLLEKTGGNVSRAASTAGIDRNYLYRLMRRHGVERPRE